MLFRNSKSFNKFLTYLIMFSVIVWLLGNAAKLFASGSFFLSNLELTATNISAATAIICSGYVIAELILNKMHKNRTPKTNKEA